MRLTLIKRFCLAFFILLPSLVTASEPEIYTQFFSNLALEGYDTVAYFDQNKPVKGDSKYSYKYKDAVWQFSSQENLEKFVIMPEEYVPQYGGYCAWLVANGDTAKGDPQYWSIENGRLYLNYDADIQKKWLVDKSGFIKKGDAMWPSVLN
jgi:YHS domain-containing protein